MNNSANLSTASDLYGVAEPLALVWWGHDVLEASDSRAKLEKRLAAELEDDPDADLRIVDVLDVIHADALADRAIAAGAIRSAELGVEHGELYVSLDWRGLHTFREVDVREGGGQGEAYRLAWIEDKRGDLGLPFETVEKMIDFSFGPADPEDLFLGRVTIEYLDGFPVAAYRSEPDLGIEELVTQEGEVLDVENELEDLAKAGLDEHDALDIIAKWAKAKPEVRAEVIEVVCGAIRAARKNRLSKAGATVSAAKVAAARANGAKGGRPAVKGWTLVESWDRLESDPELSCLCAIVERDGRRVLLAQTRGHEIMPGDWELGVACELLPSDDRAALAEDWNESTTTLDAVLAGYDETRPLLDWSGKTIAAVAKTAGL